MIKLNDRIYTTTHKKHKLLSVKKLVSHYQKNILKKKEFRNIIYDKKRYLIPGQYRLVNNRMTMMILSGDNNAKKFMNANTSHLLRTSTNKKEKIKQYVRNFIDAFFYVKLKNDKKNSYQGSLIMITGKGNIKIFDFSSNQVITFLNKHKEYEDKKNIYLKFNKYFNIPETSFIDTETALIEKIIDLIPYEELSNNTLFNSFEKVLFDYKNYFSNIKREGLDLYKKNAIYNDLSCVEDDSFRTLLYEIISMYKDEIAIPRVEVHGDLNYQNILIDEKDMYYIDWEFSKSLIFFFDIFNLMFIEAVTYLNYTYLDKYLQGDYDEHLSELFNLFSLEFDKSNKILYLSIYLIECMKNKDPIIYNNHTIHVQHKYYKTFTKILKRSN